MSIVEISAARMALYYWAAKFPEASPLSDYGTSPADMDPALVLQWSARDGQMLAAFLAWWNQATGDTEPVTTELTPSGLLALQKAAAGDMTPTNPPGATQPPPEPEPVEQPPLPPPPPPTEPQVQPLPPPPPPTTEPAPVPKKSRAVWWFLGGALGVGAVFLLRSRAGDFQGNPAVPVLTPAQSRRRIAQLRRQGCEVKVVERPEGTVVLKKCPPKKR